MKEMYTYQVARVRCKELDLLNKQDIDSLMASKTYDETIRVLADKGWGTGSEKTSEEFISAENKKLWDFINELVKDLTPFNVLLYPADYNNMKAAVKLVATNGTPHGNFKSGGTVDPEKIYNAVKLKDFSTLPKKLGETGEKAFQTFLETGDGQLCDVVADRGCLEEIKEAGKVSKEKLIKDYAELMVAIANIKVAVRCQKTKKNIGFIKEALVPCDTLDVDTLAQTATKSLDDVYSYLSSTKYSDVVEKLKESFSAFEKWCDDSSMELIKKQKVNPFTVGPIMAYIIARQNEFSTVRIILSGKLNQIDNSIITERLREMYV